MDFISTHLITTVTFFPLVGVILILALNNEFMQRVVALLVTIVVFCLSIGLYIGFKPDVSSMQFVENIPWIEQYGISYKVGIDGISLFLVLLTTYLSIIAVLACWKDIKERVKEFLICLLLLETGMIGVFVALDLFLFYIFWEAMLIPMYLLIGIWGSPGRRIYAAMKFFLYTMAGSILMLVAILVLYFYQVKHTGIHSFDLLSPS